MIKMEDTTWGIRIEMQGQPSRPELSKLLDDLRKALPSARANFGVILDLSGTGPINPELRDLLIHALRLLQLRGMARIAGCLGSSLAAAQIRRLASETGVTGCLRCIDTRKTNWKLACEHWAVSARESEDFLDGPGSTFPT